jgi:hypothetical protein
MAKEKIIRTAKGYKLGSRGKVAPTRQQALTGRIRTNVRSQSERG